MPREPWEWEEQDIERLVTDRVKEAFDLEYKDSRALRLDDRTKIEISKDVAALHAPTRRAGETGEVLADPDRSSCHRGSVRPHSRTRRIPGASRWRPGPAARHR